MRSRGSTCFASKRSGKTFSARIAALFVIALGLAVLPMPMRPAPRTPAKQLPAGTPSVNNQYGKFPLSFEPNVGQSDAQVQYIARANGYSLFLTHRETVLLLKYDSPLTKGQGQSVRIDSNRFEHGSSLRLQFVNSNPDAPMTHSDKLVGKVNYLIGDNPKLWHTNVPTFAKVTQHDLYPGVDVVYYGTQQQLEYDFVILPGADPRAIALSFSGAKSLRLDENGDLIVSA